MKADTQTPRTDTRPRCEHGTVYPMENCVDCVKRDRDFWQNESGRFEESNRQAWDTIARFREQLARLSELADQFPEINLSNYDHVDVMKLNEWGCEVFDAIRALKHTAPAAQAAPSHTETPYAWAIDLHGPADFYKREEAARGELARRNEKYPEKDRKLVPLYTAPPSAIVAPELTVERSVKIKNVLLKYCSIFPVGAIDELFRAATDEGAKV